MMKNSKANQLSNKGVCANCGKTEIYSKGLCEPCYKAQWYQSHKPLNVAKKPVGRPPLSGEKATECSCCGSKNVYARGLCYKCYKRAYQQGNITKDGVDASYQRRPTIDPATGEKRVCSYCGLQPVYVGDLCRKCDTRAKRNGGDPAYKGRSYARTMKCMQQVKKRREPQANG